MAKTLLPALYKLSSKGKVQIWEMIVEDNTYYTIAGQKGGKMTQSAPTICDGKNIGKANATTPDAQALAEATSKWQAKKDKEHYVENENDVHNARSFFEVMLAHSFEDYEDQLDFQEGVFYQDKLNGARAYAEKGKHTSRKGKEWVATPHINQALAAVFEKYPNLVFDGELYNHSLREDLGAIISLVRKTVATAADLAESRHNVWYYIYDLVTDGTPGFEKKPFIVRYQRLQQILAEFEMDFFAEALTGTRIVLVQTKKATCKDDLNKALAEAEANKIEGLIVRMNRGYVSGRSKHLLKMKSWITEEYKITGVEEGKGNLAGKVGKFVLADADGREFRSSPIGSHTYWAQMWNDRDKLIGEYATVEFKELTPVKNGKGGVPSLGKVISVRNYE